MKDMNNKSRIKQNILIFTVFAVLCGWIGYVADKVTGQANYENIGTATDKGTLGLLIWLVSPLICTVLLRSFRGDGWKDSGFSPNFKNNKIFYLISFLVYPAVTLLVILLGFITGGIRLSSTNLGFYAYMGIFLTQVIYQSIKNIFEEFVWRSYLTAQLLKLKLPDFKLYLIIGFIWWIWHLPYIMIFLSENEIRDVLPVGRLEFFFIGMAVVTSWTVMYTEIFRIIGSVWPLVIAHTMEDAVINPLLLYGIVSVEENTSFLFSLSVGIIPTALYLIVGLLIRKVRTKESYKK